MKGWRTDYSRYQRYFLNVMLFYKKRPDLQAFLEILLTLGATILFTLLALRPTLITISTLLTEIEEKGQIISQMEQKLVNLASAQTLFNREAPRVLLLDTAIPTRVSPAEFTRQLEGVANKNGVILLGVTVGETVLLGDASQKAVDETLKALPANTESFDVGIVASGTYLNLAVFIQDIENLRRPIFVDLLSINTQETDESGNLTLQISGRTPFVRGQEQ